eukprot:CAMPEP_0196223688 /NCGR_PEP_ID=MMETSP0912-20130531/47192_1 /TAXON_ID=49265 /ORGANISM="Thalassiosira rotula, Strain GSO102" /LENGTH=122 /DNA_ID=CAMNT_0041502797 /DNA_START=291 /DNA_END=656 /DNA_ORIENTATION=-
MTTTTTNTTPPSPSNNDKDTSTSNASTTIDTPSVPPGHQLITEGQITMLYPQSENSVFYNPVQVQNRDLSVLMLGMYAERRTERAWVSARRKEVRKEMMMSEQLEKEEQKKKEEEEMLQAWY